MQPIFNLFSDVEQLLLKSIIRENYQQELESFLNFFVDDIDPLTLPSEPSIISSICKDGNLAHFDVVLSILIALSTNGRLLMENIIINVKCILVNGGTGM